LKEILFIRGYPEKGWQRVVEEREPIPFPCQHKEPEVQCLPPFLKIESGIEVHPDNPNIRVREVPRDNPEPWLDMFKKRLEKIER
jgi:hypothetical protein